MVGSRAAGPMIGLLGVVSRSFIPIHTSLVWPQCNMVDLEAEHVSLKEIFVTPHKRDLTVWAAGPYDGSGFVEDSFLLPPVEKMNAAQ